MVLKIVLIHCKGRWYSAYHPSKINGLYIMMSVTIIGVNQLSLNDPIVTFTFIMYDVQLSSLFLGNCEGTSHFPRIKSRYVNNHHQVVSGYPLLLCMCGQNCAVSFKGAWWDNACHPSKINRLYHDECNNFYWCEPAFLEGFCTLTFLQIT